jgi:hypothetical protein
MAICALFMTFSAANFVAAQSLPAGMTMHRSSAGTLDATGWTLAKSTDGAFSVKLPLLFNDFTTVEQDPAAAVKRIFVVGGRTKDGFSLVATRFEYRDGEKSAQIYFNNAKTRMPPNVHVPQVNEHSIGKAPAVDVSFCEGKDADGNCASFRNVLAGPTLIMLVAEYPLARREELQPLVAKFFESLSFQPL